MKRAILFTQEDLKTMDSERMKELAMLDVSDYIDALASGEYKYVKIQMEAVCEGVLIV